MEQWKEIDGFENYEVSTHGRVRNKNTGHIIAQSHGRNKKYLTVRLFTGSRKPTIKVVYKLVAEAFIPNTENKPTVDHIDRNKDNNTVNNLRWATCNEQAQNRDYVLNAKCIYFINSRNIYHIEIRRNGIKKQKQCKTREEAETILQQFKTELGI